MPSGVGQAVMEMILELARREEFGSAGERRRVVMPPAKVLHREVEADVPALVVRSMVEAASRSGSLT